MTKSEWDLWHPNALRVKLAGYIKSGKITVQIVLFLIGLKGADR